jgi:hypothetical protein
MIGSSGTMTIFGACLDSTTQVSIQNAGSSNAVTLGAVTPLGWGEVQVQYSVAAGSAPETAVLTVSTSGGSVTASLQVVPSLPYISAVIPDVWPAGQQTPVTISGAGFGTSPLTGCSLSNLQVSSSSSVIFCVTGWSDGAIQGTATVAANDPGEVVTISVTGGNYGLAFQAPASQGQASNQVVTQTTPTTAYSVTQSPLSLNLSTGDTNVIITTSVSLPAMAFTPAFSWNLANNPKSACNANLGFANNGGVSPVNSTVAASLPGCSGIFTVEAVVGSVGSSQSTQAIVPPQIMIRTLVGEAGLQTGSGDNTMPVLLLVGMNRFNDSAFTDGCTGLEPTNWQNTCMRPVNPSGG